MLQGNAVVLIENLERDESATSNTWASSSPLALSLACCMNLSLWTLGLFNSV